MVPKEILSCINTIEIHLHSSAAIITRDGTVKRTVFQGNLRLVFRLFSLMQGLFEACQA